MNNNYTINAELVRKIISDKGFFYIEAKKCYGDDFIGPELIVATDDKDFLSNHPEYAEMIIVSVAKFIMMQPVDTSAAHRAIRHDLERASDKYRL